jgi:hypothetical protein
MEGIAGAPTCTLSTACKLENTLFILHEGKIYADSLAAPIPASG